jgi:hypothetical protein
LWLAHKEDPKLSEKPHLVKAHLVSAPDFGLTFDLLLAGVSGSCDGRQLEEKRKSFLAGLPDFSWYMIPKPEK